VAIDHGLRRLVLRTLLPAFPGRNPPAWATALAAEGVGGYIIYGYNIADPDQLRALTGHLREANPHALISTDEEGGDVTRLAHVAGSPYPGNAALGAVDEPALTERIFRAIGTDLAAAGFGLNFAPSLDVNTAADNPVIGTRSFGADPARVAEHGAAAITGLQAAGVAASAKHFPGHGATTTDSHLELPTVDVPMEVLRERDLAPFAAAVKAGTRAVMTAHIRVPALTGDQPATFSSRVVVDLLRGELGFTGALITDALEMRGAAAIAGGVPRAAAIALAAGNDLLCLGSRVDEELVEATIAEIGAAVRDGRLPASRLEDAAAHVDALAGWVDEVRPAAHGARAELTGIGYPAAARAIRVEGTLAGLSAPLIIQIESASSIAAGPVPWGLRQHATGVEHLRVEPGIAAEQVRRRAGTRPIVVVGRNLHGQAGAPALIEALATSHRVVVVEMGWPSPWRPAGAQAFVTTHGASHANGRDAGAGMGLT
jgi:beta-N-acetylhexosaminidase